MVNPLYLDKKKIIKGGQEIIFTKVSLDCVQSHNIGSSIVSLVVCDVHV